MIDMEKQEQVAMQFMLYAYFKLDINATEDEIVQKALDRAYSDATNEGAYNTRLYDDMKNPAETEKKERKAASDQVRDQAAEHIRSLLKSLSSCENMEDFDTEHTKACQALVEDYEKALGAQKFTYGNAQKWVNMSLKYLYLLGGALHACGRSVDFQKGINRCIAWLHVPIDSYIMEALYQEVELPLRNANVAYSKVRSKETYSSVTNYLQPWSKWTEDQYVGAYDNIRQYAKNKGTDDCALVWENDAWIAVAKKRKNQ